MTGAANLKARCETAGMLAGMLIDMTVKLG
jgi:hypothetical protein